MKYRFCLLMLALSSIPAFAQLTQAPMQTSQDRAEGNRLIINNQAIFVSGMNIAWHSFGNDLHDNDVVSESTFRSYIKGVKDAGGNAVRWWLHNDASFCPKIDANGRVTGLAAKSIESMRRVLDIAYEQGVVVSMCLFSHNLMKAGSKASWSNFNLERNYKLFTSAANMDTYIDKALKPILAAVGNHPAVMAWEVFNEPEGMSSEFGSGWGMDNLIPHDDIITFTAKVAVAVHENSKKMVSTGIHEFNKSSYFPRYTEAKLKTAAGNNEKAYLDFYMAHWYPDHQSWCGTSCSPFHNKASFWGLSRPVVIGEFPGKSWTSPSNTAMTITAAYEYAYNNEYAGALGWALTDANYGSIQEVSPALKNLSNKYKSDIEICTATGASCSPAPPQSSSSNNPSSSSSSSATSNSSSSSSLNSSSSNQSSSSNSLACSLTNAGTTGTVGTAVNTNVFRVTCNGTQTTTLTWPSVADRTPASEGDFTITVTRPSTSNTCAGQTANCTISIVSGDTPSSSSLGATPILSQNYQQGETALQYYNLQGQPLGNAKPKEPGVYVVKNLKTGQIQKEVVK